MRTTHAEKDSEASPWPAVTKFGNSHWDHTASSTGAMRGTGTSEGVSNTAGGKAEHFHTYMVRREMKSTEERITARVLREGETQVLIWIDFHLCLFLV